MHSGQMFVYMHFLQCTVCYHELYFELNEMLYRVIHIYTMITYFVHITLADYIRQSDRYTCIINT